MPVTCLSYASKYVYFTILCLPYLLILMVSAYHSIDCTFVMSHVAISCVRCPSGVILAAAQPPKYYHPNVSLSFIRQILTPPKFCVIWYNMFWKLKIYALYIILNTNMRISYMHMYICTCVYRRVYI